MKPKSRPRDGGADFRVGHLRTESQANPVGIDQLEPRLSWRLLSTARGVRQTAYQFRVATSEAGLRQNDRPVFDSGRVQSDQSTHLRYRGPRLRSRGRYHWQVRAWDEQGRVSAWSEPAFWEMGLLAPRDWRARWIEPGWPDDPVVAGPAPMLRREFSLRAGIVRARIYVTSRGLYELHLNGRRVGDQVLAPGWTSYHHRLQYQVYDVTAQVGAGANALGAILGDGWYRGTLGFTPTRHHYGAQVGLLAQLEVVHDDGRTETITTGRGWKTATGPILSSDLYHGETYDARRERAGWDRAGYDDRDWPRAKLAAPTAAKLIAQGGPPIRRIEELKPVRLFMTPAGQTVADLGQNMVGWIRLRVRGPAGTTVTLRHAEVLDREGNFYTDNLREARQEIRYTLHGRGEEVYEPRFTFQGFRYVAVEGFPGKLSPASLTGIVVHSDMEPAGVFETSDPLINQLQHNIVWGQKGNFVDVPTDCPQRDERLGWTGDAQVFAATAAFNLDVAGFFTKWLGDLAADQSANGRVPFVVPDILREMDTRGLEGAPAAVRKRGKVPAGGAAGWSDAATIIPWNLYLAYGDAGILKAQYRSMVRWVRYLRARAGAGHVWRGDLQFGDWLDFFSTENQTRFGATSADLIATAFYAHSVDLLARTAQVLGRTAAAGRFARLFARIRKAFCGHFVLRNGRVGAGTQTAQALALEFDLLPGALQPLAAAKLAADVRQRGHLTTGFLGTPHLLRALSRFGYLEESYRLLNRRDFPSWLYPVTRGATTIWERWDGIKPDGSFQNSEMNSFNHYAYGAVGEWMYRVMAGLDIDPANPGYKHSLIRPQPGGGFTHVKASHETPHGRLSSAWKIKRGRFDLEIEVPPNTRATVWLPRATITRVRESGHPLGKAAADTVAAAERDSVVVEVGSGRYHFSYPIPK